MLSLFLRPIHHVIPAQAGIQQRAVLPAKDIPRTADAVHWIPACAGMTMGVARELSLTRSNRAHPKAPVRPKDPTVLMNWRHETVHGPSES